MLHGQYEIQDSAQHVAGKSYRVDIAAKVVRIVVEYGGRFRLVDVEPVPHDRFVRIVGAPLLVGAIENALDKRFVVIARQVQNEFHVNVSSDHLALCSVPRDAIEKEDLAVRGE